jgi:hypothetical protein
MKQPTSKTHNLLAIAVSAVLFGIVGHAQVPASPPPARPERVRPKAKIKQKLPKVGATAPDLPPGVEMGDGTTSERSIIVDPKVSVQMCVTEGTVRVNGWKRSELRAFVSDGSKFAFHVLEKSPSGSPVLVSLVGVRGLPGGAATTVECIAGEDIEIDVPENSSLSLKGRETETSIDMIRKVWVNSVGGDIMITNVPQGVRASTFQGNVTVENSSGVMVLESSSGNIVAYGVAPSEVGDTFKAKTNSGEISLQKLGYRLVDVTSLSGTVAYVGELLSGGSLSFSTTNGAIRLAIPEKSSCRVTATFGFGNFNSELPLKTLTEDVRSGPAKTVNAIMGTGDATLRLTTSSGSIQIKKLQP